MKKVAQPNNEEKTMHFRRLLKNLHLSLIVADLHKKEMKQSDWDKTFDLEKITRTLTSYNLAFALYVPYFVVRIAVYALRQRITGEDIYKVKSGDAVGQMIYSILSETEWCDEFVLWLRILLRTERFYVKNGVHEEIQVPSQETILEYLLLSEGFLCERRMESKKEYVGRKLDELSPDETCTNLAAIRMKFEIQFDLILSMGEGNALKEYCLGRKFRFLKIPRYTQTCEVKAVEGISCVSDNSARSTSSS